MSSQDDAPSAVHLDHTRRSEPIERAGGLREHAGPGLDPGTVLEPKGIYMDLSVHGSLPFVAIPGQVAGKGNRYVARRDFTQAQWNRLVEEAAP